MDLLPHALNLTYRVEMNLWRGHMPQKINRGIGISCCPFTSSILLDIHWLQLPFWEQTWWLSICSEHGSLSPFCFSDSPKTCHSLNIQTHILIWRKEQGSFNEPSYFIVQKEMQLFINTWSKFPNIQEYKAKELGSHHSVHKLVMRAK